MRLKKYRTYSPNTWEISLYRIAAIIIISALVLSLYGLYLIAFPKDIITYPKGTTWKIVNSPVTAGSYLAYNLYYCKHTEDISTVYQTLSGKYTYTLGQVQRNIPLGCHQTIISDIFIPPTVVPGIYRLYVTVEYRPNPLRTVQYFVKTEPFTVIAPKPLTKDGE